MAGQNLSPRQKMIGMMYLVLTAMLALNVQREILDAFVVLNEGIEKSTESNFNKNEILYSDFKFAYNLDKEKVEKYYEHASQIQEECNTLITGLDSLKVELISVTEGIPTDVADTLSVELISKLDSYNDATRILIGTKEDGSEGRARMLQNNVTELTQSLNSHLEECKIPSMNFAFDFSDRKEEGKSISWENYTFYDTPLAAVLALLSKMQNDIRSAEYNAVSRLYAQVDVEDIPIDTVLAKVIPQSNYVMLGENYSSDIFLGAYSTTSQPEIILGELDPVTGELIGEGTPLEVEEGMGRYTVITNREGIHQYSGVLRVRDKQGNLTSFPFNNEYLVAKPNAVVSPISMNVLYVGPDNPLAISVPGVPDEDIIATIDGGNRLEKMSNGTYVAKMITSSPSTVNVSVKARMENGETKAMGRLEFRVKRLPKPYVRFGEITNNGKMRKADLKANCLTPEYDKGFVFDLPLTLVSFTLVVQKRDGTWAHKISRTRCLSQDMKTLIDAQRPGSKIYFEDVIVEDVNKSKIPCNSIIVTLRR